MTANIKITIKNTSLVLLAAFLLISACKKDEVVETAPRLFRPVLKGDMESQGNWISASWQQTKEAASYKVEISRDTFKTIEASLSVDTNTVVFENLQWNQLYQIQVLAIAEDTSRNSKWSYLGEMKTAKFPTIITAPTSNDVTDVAARLNWTNTGAAVTSIKVLNAIDSSLVKEIPLTDADIANQFKKITGLTASTGYIIYLYSGETIRGWENYMTKAPLEFPGSTIIDLRGITDDPDALNNALQTAASGSVIILDRGETYTISSGPVLSGSITITSGLGFEDIANIKINSNFDFAAGSSIDSVKFSNVAMTGADFGGTYVMNISNSTTVGKIIFDACKMNNFRGITRIKASSPVAITDYIVNNCVIDSINGYGVLAVDNAAATVQNIKIQNSTVYKAIVVVTSKTPSNSILIENSTFNEAPQSGKYIIDYDDHDVTLPVQVNNCILGIGWAKDGDDNISVRGIRVGPNSTVSSSGTYTTGDYSATSNIIPGLIPYNQDASYIFKDPANGDFTIQDQTFDGKSSAGDPRWRK